MSMELWDPFGQAVSLREAMDRLLQDSFIRPSGGTARSGSERTLLLLDIHESDDSYTIEASLPGMKPEDVQIEIAGDTITIRAEKQEEREERRGDQILMRERRLGRYARTFTLPLPVDAEHAEATLKHGVLTLRLPKTMQARQRRVEVRSADGEQTQQVTAQSTSGQSQGAGQDTMAVKQ